MSPIVKVLSAISNEKSLALFNILAGFELNGTDSNNNDNKNRGNNTAFIQRKLGLSRKQFYSRMASLMEAGLVKRKSREYFITSFGKLISNLIQIIQTGLDNQAKLAAIDLLKIEETIPQEERDKIINILLTNNRIKELITNKGIVELGQGTGQEQNQKHHKNNYENNHGNRHLLHN
jgi:DNA-binding transcriptional ArsR family regulator